jgi:hypothetical protein
LAESPSLKRRLWVAAALAAGLLLRAAGIPFAGSLDVPTSKTYAEHSSLTSLYPGAAAPRTGRAGRETGAAVDPPLSIYELAAVGRIYRAIEPAFPDGPARMAALKLPGILAELALVAWLLRKGAAVFGERAATWTAVAFWLNPAVIMNGALLGYRDAQMAVPAVLALIAAVAGWGLGAGALAAAAVLTRTQALFVVPVVACASLLVRPPSAGRFLRFLLAAALAAAIVLLPIGASGSWLGAAHELGRLAGGQTAPPNALNGWWFYAWSAHALHSLGLGWPRALDAPRAIHDILQPVARQSIAWVLVATGMLWGLSRARRAASHTGWALIAAWCVSAAVMLGPEASVNHACLTVPFLAVAGGLDRRLRPLFWTASVLIAINFYIVDGATLGWPGSHVLQRAWSGIDVKVVVAVANLGVCGWIMTALIEETSSPSPAERSRVYF